MSNGTIQSLERGLAILTLLGKAQDPLGLNEIAAHFPIDRSSVFRLVRTMVVQGFITQNPETKKYALGFKVLELAGAFLDQQDIERLFRPLMRSLCTATRQNTHLALLDDGEVVFIAVEQPRDTITVSISVGAREPAPPTALGRALLAFLDQERLDLLTPSPEAGTLAEVRAARLAIDDEEFKPGIICLAAPIFDHRGQAPYSIGISGPAEMIRPHQAEFAHLVENAGIEASRLLGHRGRA